MQKNIDNAPTEKSENFKENDVSTNESQLPEYMKICAELSLNMALTENELRDRCFHLQGGLAIFGVCIAELPDSFLVAAPCQLVSEDGQVGGRSFSRVSVIRLIRSSIVFITIPDNQHKYYYYNWLKKQFSQLPSFFSQDRRDVVTDFLYTYENRSKTKKTEQVNSAINLAEFLEDEALEESSNTFLAPYISTEFH